MASLRSKTALDNYRKIVITRIFNIRRVVEKNFAALESWFSEATRRIIQTDEEDENEPRRALVEGKKEDYSSLFDDDYDVSMYNSPSTRLHDSTP